MVVDCGGGTVDLTVHELDSDTGVLKELHKGTGGPCGATGKNLQAMVTIYSNLMPFHISMFCFTAVELLPFNPLLSTPSLA